MNARVEIEILVNYSPMADSEKPHGLSCQQNLYGNLDDFAAMKDAQNSRGEILYVHGKISKSQIMENQRFQEKISNKSETATILPVLEIISIFDPKQEVLIAERAYSVWKWLN